MAALPPLASPAYAQAAGMAGVGQSEVIAFRANVNAVDMNARTITLTGPRGNAFTFKVGDAVQNLAQVKPGDNVIAHIFSSRTFVLSPPGATLPPNSLTLAGAGAPTGSLPAGMVASRLVVTGLVVSVDTANHTLQLVDPQGGPVRTVNVVTPQVQQAMGMVKPGDTITAVIDDVLLAQLEPAT
ncbi:hypothetical protein [Limobrevibacterium gyesilva]|uniref:Uncharacterized protein n=1 Tax=Limobrevibacterium gyesilva TaxID=2991712 RepID=A0AA41YQE7_9PROT|nr:hypothetical protein [Limobrevibacterium gyesilva]MCW3476677.1 hypothetical protein [Limobrevibacterium gyesilva]